MLDGLPEAFKDCLKIFWDAPIHLRKVRNSWLLAATGAFLPEELCSTCSALAALTATLDCPAEKQVAI